MPDKAIGLINSAVTGEHRLRDEQLIAQLMHGGDTDPYGTAGVDGHMTSIQYHGSPEQFAEFAAVAAPSDPPDVEQLREVVEALRAIGPEPQTS